MGLCGCCAAQHVDKRLVVGLGDWNGGCNQLVAQSVIARKQLASDSWRQAIKAGAKFGIWQLSLDGVQYQQLPALLL